jgi:adenine phosphoribosyltransferase
VYLTLGFQRDLVSSGDRVLLIDDWIATGAQALASQALVGLERSELRWPLKLKSLLHMRDL